MPNPARRPALLDALLAALPAAVLGITAAAPSTNLRTQVPTEPPPLVQNGGGENPAAVLRGNIRGAAYYGLPGWTAVEGTWLTQAGAFSGITAVEGARFLRADQDDHGELRQDVDLTSLPEGLPEQLLFTCYLRTHIGRDEVELSVTLLDEDGGELGGDTTGPCADPTWTQHVLLLNVPRGASVARLTLRGEKHDGKYLDAFADGIRLEPLGENYPVGWSARRTGRLLETIEEVRPDVPRSALISLASRKDTKAADLLVAIFEEQPAAKQRELLPLLALQGSKPCVAALTAVAEGKDATNGALAMKLLAIADAPGWEKAMAGLAEDTSNVARAAAALGTLARYGGSGAVGPLQRLFARADRSAQYRILSAIGRGQVPMDPIYTGILRPLLESKGTMQNRALETLGARRDPRFLNHMRRLMTSTTSRYQVNRWFQIAARVDGLEALNTMLDAVGSRPSLTEELANAVVLMRDPKVLRWARSQALGARLAGVRLGAVRLISATRKNRDRRILERCVDDKDARVALAAIDGLSDLTGGNAARMLEDMARDERPRVSARAAKALADRHPGAGTWEILAELAEEARLWEVRVAALQALGKYAASSHLDLFRAAVTDEHRKVRSAAYRSMAEIRTRAAVDILMARLPEEPRGTGAFRDLLDALVTLTGMDIGNDPAVWQKWWSLVQAEFEVAAEPVTRRSTKGTSAISYYGVPIHTDRLVFIIDLSGSMTAKVDGGGTRLDQAKRELIQVLEALRDSGVPKRFAVITFSDDVDQWKEQMVLASPENVEAASRWIKNLAARGSTNIYDSLEKAMFMDEADSIFLLTDGGPSAGKIVDKDGIRNAIDDLNAERMMRIHTIGIGTSGSNQRFLELLAEENRGNAAIK